MQFLWPDMLWLLAALPALAGAYWIVLRRRKSAALRYPNLGILRDAMAGHVALRRHVPPLLLLTGLAAILFSAARPSAVVTLPSHHEAVILAIDVSGSMRARDVHPSRLAAAQAAAKAFIAEQRSSTRIGIVEFSGSAALVQPPTRSREDLHRAIDALMPQNATAIGSGILVSINALFPEAQKSPPKPAEPGSHTSGAVILLTDGQNSSGPDAIQAAREAAARGVRVYTVGIGTAQGELVHVEGWSMRVALDEVTLRKVADLTAGEYLNATSAAELKKVYEVLTSKVLMEKQSTEITALFSAAGGLVIAVAALLSLLWFNRIL
jgi:Ca-activated chloride channel family protein